MSDAVGKGMLVPVIAVTAASASTAFSGMLPAVSIAAVNEAVVNTVASVAAEVTMKPTTMETASRLLSKEPAVTLVTVMRVALMPSTAPMSVANAASNEVLAAGLAMRATASAA